MHGPDDITLLGGHLFVGFQNGVGPKGQASSSGATTSTVQEYTRSGHPLGSWTLTGHVDGLTADRAHHRLVATVNEDGNSSLYTITPTAAPGEQLDHFSYNRNPLPHGGGTDAVSFVGGRMLLSASSPTGAGGPAVYAARLSGGTAHLTPVFSDHATATVANAGPTAGHAQKLDLTDPDSNEVVPQASPRFAGDFVLDSQGDKEQVYVDDPGSAHPELSVLHLSHAINDTAWATARRGTLYITENKNNKVLALRGRFRPGTAYVAVTPNSGAPGYLGVLNLSTGAIRPVLSGIHPEGMIFVPSHRHGSSASHHA
ncbi:MAG TPA: hypothetical protein VE152_07220 [Acidimicrobiales bacterium]|nr:hypothetical protein [Acidimicrobiales bacterium]